jgi:ABC-type branched-subunit amino acid transport system substrate-binding protein
MSTALTGKAEALGKGMREGVEAYFKQINEKGGVNGRKIELVVKDDQYEPANCAKNTRELIEKDKVFALIGNVGTPTAQAALDVAKESNTLMFGFFTGAGILRKSPPDKFVINYRASYAQETKEMVDGFIKLGYKPEEIVFFTQNDAYGNSGFEGGIAALKAAGLKDEKKVIHVRYERNTENVSPALETLLDSGVKPKAIIMVGAYAACGKFIKLAKDEGLDCLFANVSFVGSEALLNKLKGYGEKYPEGVIVTQVVPNFEADLPGVKEYQENLKKSAPDSKPSFVSLEGYIAAKVFVEGLKKAGENPDKENILKAVLSLKDLDLGIGEKISFEEGKNHQGSQKVWLTRIKGGKFVSFTWDELKK